MDMTIFIHELKQNRKTFFIWAFIVAGMNFIFLLIYPQMVGEIEGMQDMYSNLGSFSAAFGMDKINFAAPMGYYGLYDGVMLAIGGGMFAAVIGGNILCKEEGSHTAEFLFTTPLSRENIAMQKLLAAAILVVMFNIICMLAGISGIYIIGEEIEWSIFLLFHLAQVCMHIEVCTISYCMSAHLRRPSMGMAIGISLLFYFLQMMANISEKVEWVKYITPYYYADAANILPRESIEWQLLLLGMVYACIAAAIGLRKIGVKDLNP